MPRSCVARTAQWQTFHGFTGEALTPGICSDYEFYNAACPSETAQKLTRVLSAATRKMSIRLNSSISNLPDTLRTNTQQLA